MKPAKPVPFLPMDHAIARKLRAYKIPGQKILLAVSGGLDSLVLFHVMVRLRKILNLELAVAHVNHGSSRNPRLRAFRLKAQKYVQALSEKHGVPFYTNSEFSKIELKSEDDLRNFRYSQFEKFQNLFAPDGDCLLGVAHHADDLLETQLLRLIRGTGPQGLQAMAYRKDNTLRPLLNISRKEIEKYARRLKIKPIQDPSNKSTDPMRNWLRYHWLRSLDKRMPGGRKSLAQSLENLAQSFRASGGNAVISDHKQGLPLDALMNLDHENRQQRIAHYLLSLGVRNYSHKHVNEILKRLDSSKWDTTFILLKHHWSINAGHILARPIHENEWGQ